MMVVRVSLGDDLGLSTGIVVGDRQADVHNSEEKDEEIYPGESLF